MKIPTSFQILSSFSASELKKLMLFLKSPYFNKQKSYVLLLKEWQKNRGKAIDRRRIYAKVLPDKPYLDRDWYLLMCRFHDKIEQYLIWQEVQADELAASSFLVKAIRRLQKHQLFEVAVNRLRRLREKKQVYIANQIYQAYELEMEYYDFIASYNRNEKTNLQEVSDTLDHHFIAEKLKHACLAHSRLIASNETYDLRYLNMILADIECRPELLKVPAIAIYKACYAAVVAEGDEADFKHLRITIDQYGSGFPGTEIRDIYLLAINYCIKAMNEGKKDFEALAFTIYQDSLEKGYLLEDGYISESVFFNMVALGIKRKLFDWTAAFIHTQKAFLKADQADTLIDFNLAQLYYAQGFLEKAAKALIRVNTKSPFLYLGAKGLLLKVLYEAQEWDALNSTLESLRVYLQRRKDLGYSRTHYKLLYQFFRQLIQLKPGDKAAKKALRVAIMEADAFRMKEWFLERI